MWQVFLTDFHGLNSLPAPLEGRRISPKCLAPEPQLGIEPRFPRYKGGVLAIIRKGRVVFESVLD